MTSSLKASQHLYPGLIFVTLDLGLLISLVLDNITFYTLGEDQQYFSKLHSHVRIFVKNWVIKNSPNLAVLFCIPNFLYKSQTVL